MSRSPSAAVADAEAAAFPPGPRGGRWLGNTPEYDRDRLGFLVEAAARYGDVFSFSPSTIVVNDPELIREVLVRSNTDFLTEGPLFRNEKDLERSTTLVSSWMDGRRAGRARLNALVIENLGRAMTVAMDSAVSPRTGTAAVPVFETMRKFTGALLTRILLGPGAEDTAGAVERRSATWMTFMDSNLTYPKWFPRPALQRALSAERRLDRTLVEHIRSHRTAPADGPESLLGHLLAEQPDIDDLVLKRLLKASLVASYGSPGVALTWTVKTLAERADLADLIAREAAAAPPSTDGRPDPSHAPFTSAFVKEILRLYPPTWLMGRTVLRPCRLGDWHLRPGLELMFSPYLVHRDPRWWPEPEQFRVERWLEGAGPRTGTAYFPFGAGPRACVGARMATVQLVAATMHLATAYRIEITAPAVRTAPGALLLPEGLHARFTRRDS